MIQSTEFLLWYAVVESVEWWMSILGIHFGSYAYIVFAILLALTVLGVLSVFLMLRMDEKPQLSRRKTQDLWTIIGLEAFILLVFLWILLTVYPSAL
jgi:hydrogenase-4 membrane subunit HyfE